MKGGSIGYNEVYEANNAATRSCWLLAWQNDCCSLLQMLKDMRITAARFDVCFISVFFSFFCHRVFSTRM